MLLEVFHSSLEHLDVVVAGDILVAAIAETFAVAHLAEDTAIGRGDALDGEDGAVGIEVDISGGLVQQIHVLGGDLTVGSQLADGLQACVEAALAVGDGHIEHIAHVHRAQPGAHVGGHTGADDPGLVAADDVVGQGGHVAVTVHDLAIGHQTQLHQSLEAVADTQHQAVPVIQQVGDLLLDGGVAEEGGDELAGAVGLVAAGEAAGDEDHLGIGNLGGELLHAAGNVLCDYLLILLCYSYY